MKRGYRRGSRKPYGYKPRKPFRDVYQEVTDRIIAELEKGTVPWNKPWSGTDVPTNLYTGKPYRGANVFLLGFSPYSSRYWLGYNQAQYLGGYVREGETSTKILKWNVKEIKDRFTGETTGSYMYPLFLSVYNAEQCSGLDTPDASGPDVPPIEAAERIIEGMPCKPVIVHGNGGASYNPRTDMVAVPGSRMFTSREEYYSTLFHELAHSTGHPSRLNRQAAFGNGFGSERYAKEELTAETAAAFLCARCGIERGTEGNAASYCGYWLGILRNDKKIFIQAASQGERAASYILGTDREKKERG